MTPRKGPSLVLNWEDVAPRRPEERYRIYTLRRGDLRLLATADCGRCLGGALLTLSEEGEFEGHAVGVLDTFGREDVPGVWIINPFEHGK